MQATRKLWRVSFDVVIREASAAVTGSQAPSFSINIERSSPAIRAALVQQTIVILNSVKVHTAMNNEDCKAASYAAI